jgi:apolipoprotein N-acyltransferase
MPWLAPEALAGIFAAWMMLSPRSAAFVGYLSGLVFFSANASWFGETAGKLMGPYAFVIVLGPAALEALAFALAATLTAIAARHLSDNWIPWATASGFTLAEILRSTGVLGLPMYQIGSAFVATPFAPLLAYGGVYTVTFVIALIAATLGIYLRRPEKPNIVRLVLFIIGITFVSMSAWMSWPAKDLPTGTIHVAAIQGNLKQSVSWNPKDVPIAIKRYTDMTRSISSFHPQFVLWPETVITDYLQIDSHTAAVPSNAKLAAAAKAQREQFGALAKELHTNLAVGSNEFTETGSYNDLFFFAPNGKMSSVYRKHQLVPFAEFLPGPTWLRKLPFAPLVSDMRSGNEMQSLGPLRVSPLICWEADFGDLASREAARGAAFFAVATDDAWFGTSDGPYQQAEIAQLRAIETGRWIVRAATTGISGIISPDGNWQSQADIGSQKVITGTIGEPLSTIYNRIGPTGASLGILVIGIIAFWLGRKPTAKNPKNRETNAV